MQPVVGNIGYANPGVGSPPLPQAMAGEAAHAVPQAQNLIPVLIRQGNGVVSMSGQSTLGRVPSPQPADGLTPIAENW